MGKQLNLFSGAELKDIGINRALENAESKNKGWGAIAYGFLLEYIKKNKTFLAEDVSNASYGIVPEPPSKRAWGAIFVMAKKNNIIKKAGYSPVKNPKAHRTPATLWTTNKYT